LPDLSGNQDPAAAGDVAAGLSVAQKVVASIGGIDESGNNPSGAAPINVLLTPAEMEIPVDDARP
jgi:hypothetical protein